MKSILTTSLFILLSGFSLSAFAVPALLTHQGHIVDTTNSPITGVAQVTFKLYSHPTANSSVWSQALDVTFDGGNYSVELGPGTPTLSTDILDGSDLYLGITLESNEEFVPRTKLTSVPYSIRSEISDSVEGSVNAVDGLYVNGHQVIDSSGNMNLEGTLTVPQGAFGDLPSAGNGNKGELYYANDQNKLYFSNGSEWVDVSAGGSGSSGDVVYPEVVSIDPDQIEPGEDATITLSGQNFEDGFEVEFNSIVATSHNFAGSTEVSATTGTELVSGNYNVRLTNPHGLRDTLVDGLVVDAIPVWQTEAGSLGFIVDASTGTHRTFVATDAEGQTLTYTMTSGSLPPGVSLNTETGELSGDPDDVSDDQEYTFEITVSDTARTPNESARVFNILITHLIGAVAEAPANDCKHVIEMDSSRGDGIYWIDPDGGDNSNAYQVYCNMDTAGGGWILVMQIQAAHTDVFGFQKNYWATANVLNETVPETLSDINAKYGTFNTFTSVDGHLMMMDKTTGNHSVLAVPDMAGTTLLNRFQTLGSVNNSHHRGIELTLVDGSASPQELMGYPTPTTMCSQFPVKWRFNHLSSYAGIRIGNDVASNGLVTNAPSDWSCYNSNGNLSYSGAGGTLENGRQWQDSYGSESLNRWRSSNGSGQGSQKGVSIFVR